MEMSWHDRRSVLRIVLTASLVNLSFELTLIRIFSISLWYYFAFMVISIAMLGIGALAVDVSACFLDNSPRLESSRRVKNEYALNSGPAGP